MQQPISVGNLLLDIGNYRIVKQNSQKAARDSIIAEQGRKLVKLADDIINVGLSPIDLTLVIDAGDGNGNFIVIEGNRRLVALQLMLTPDLADGTPVHAAFKKIHKEHSDAIPKVLDCVIAPNRKAGLVWIMRKHSNGLEGAGTEHWSAMAKARADAQQGVLSPALDAVNFVLASPNVDENLRAHLLGSKFNITTLDRLIKAKDVQDAVGFKLQEGKLVTEQDEARIRTVFTNLISVIASGKHAGDKFTERNVDTEEHRNVFLDKFLPRQPERKKATSTWEISGTPKAAERREHGRKSRGTPSTEDQPNLIPRKFKLDLPAGKVNDIFIELKELDVTKRRHAVSVLFRVFVEFTIDDFIRKHGLCLPVDKNGKPRDHLIEKLKLSIAHAESSALLSSKELKPIKVRVADRDSLVSPETLNAYVHSPWMNPDPLQLKLSWASLQLFIERLWTSKK